MIDFELPEQIRAAQLELREFALNHMRPIAREYDEKEHEIPWDFINMTWEETKKSMVKQLAALDQTRHVEDSVFGYQQFIGPP